ncbi:MAG: sensor histidine kinase [Pseudobdellovibrio sp.]
MFEHSLKSRDLDLLSSKAKLYASFYSKGGLQELDQRLTEEKQSDEQSQFLVRIEGNDNGSLFLRTPDKLKNLKKEEIEKALISAENKGSVSRFVLNGDIKSDDEDDEYEFVTLSLADGKKIQVAQNTNDREDLLERYLGIIFIASFAILFIGSVGGFIFSSQTLAPLRNLIQTMKKIYSGELNARVPIRNSNDELDEIGLLFNKMTNKIERLILSMQQTLDNVAHDLKTPLTRLKAKSELMLLKSATEAEYKATLADTIENTSQIVSLINTIMDISEADAGILKLSRVVVNSQDIIADVIDLYSIVAEEKNIFLSFNPEVNFNFSADENRFKQVLSNLIDNAIKYSPSGSKIEISSRVSGLNTQISVKDNGIGISTENLAKIWERLFRADEARTEKGMGLGLNLVKSICKAHGWQIRVESQHGSGSEFILELGRVEIEFI